MFSIGKAYSEKKLINMYLCFIHLFCLSLIEMDNIAMFCGRRRFIVNTSLTTTKIYMLIEMIH